MDDAIGRESNRYCVGAAYTTCFRPTPYMDMHLGHAWCAYRNWDISARLGGRFHLILDDEQYRLSRHENNPVALSLAEAKEHYVEDLEWLGCPPDEVHFSSEARGLMLESAARLNIREPQIVRPENPLEGMLFRRIGQSSGHIIQYTPWTTLSAVVEHHFFGVTGFCRGADLVHEALLYDYLCCALGWVAPEQFYIPVVRRGWGYTKESKSDAGSHSHSSLRELRRLGITGEQVIDTLRELDFRREQEGRDAINIPLDVLNLPPLPGTIPYHLKT
ncbi:MAG: glutamyl-Q tRNA(Asp) synthetase [Chloroflexi bacterium ADurb.Bin180]|nr:MAG: glutamyl-Q tRNA(Asp) synthetase [Chloroflexi bacterium ADurb.Bin180]